MARNASSEQIQLLAAIWTHGRKQHCDTIKHKWHPLRPIIYVLTMLNVRDSFVQVLQKISDRDILRCHRPAACSSFFMPAFGRLPETSSDNQLVVLITNIEEIPKWASEICCRVHCMSITPPKNNASYNTGYLRTSLKTLAHNSWASLWTSHLYIYFFLYTPKPLYITSGG